jgi:hypothetical protein
MNVTEQMMKLMQGRGLNEREARLVIERVMKSDKPELKLFREMHDQSVPEPTLGLFWYPVREEALQYIEENCPLAWFKPMFFDQEAQNNWLRVNGGEHLIKD